MVDLVWYVPLAASVFLFIAIVYLATKNRRFDREVAKFNRRKAKFLAGLPETPKINSKGDLPDLKSAMANRRLVIGARTKKREARQRRLVEHLKDLQAKESE